MEQMDAKWEKDLRSASRSNSVERYVAPVIKTYSSEEFLNLLGPAQGYGGDNIGRRDPGLGYRLFPGLR